jgi:hypothetical protein
MLECLSYCGSSERSSTNRVCEAISMYQSGNILARSIHWNACSWRRRRKYSIPCAKVSRPTRQRGITCSLPTDCVCDCVWLALPQPTEWQRIRDEIDVTFIFAQADFVNMHGIKLLFPSGDRVSFSSQVFSQFDFHLGRRFEGHWI